jgi:hypothetical protein
MSLDLKCGHPFPSHPPRLARGLSQRSTWKEGSGTVLSSGLFFFFFGVALGCLTLARQVLLPFEPIRQPYFGFSRFFLDWVISR